MVARKRSRKRLSSKLPEVGYDLKRGNKRSQGERKGVYSWASQTQELPSEPFTVSSQELLSSMGSETMPSVLLHSRQTPPGYRYLQCTGTSGRWRSDVGLKMLTGKPLLYCPPQYCSLTLQDVNGLSLTDVTATLCVSACWLHSEKATRHPWCS